jgi:hypothetical protein
MATGIEPITLPWKRPEKGVSAAELGASFRVEQREDGWHCTVRVGRRAEVLATGMRRLRDAQCRAEAHAATLPEVAAALAQAEAAKAAAKTPGSPAGVVVPRTRPASWRRPSSRSQTAASAARSRTARGSPTRPARCRCPPGPTRRWRRRFAASPRSTTPRGARMRRGEVRRSQAAAKTCGTGGGEAREEPTVKRRQGGGEGREDCGEDSGEGDGQGRRPRRRPRRRRPQRRRRRP